MKKKAINFLETIRYKKEKSKELTVKSKSPDCFKFLDVMFDMTFDRAVHIHQMVMMMQSLLYLQIGEEMKSLSR